MLGIALAVVLVLAFLALLPQWGHRQWTYYPTGRIGMALLVSSCFCSLVAFEQREPALASALARATAIILLVGDPLSGYAVFGARGNRRSAPEW